MSFTERLKWLSRSSMLKSTMVLTIIAAVSSLALAAVNMVTADPIKENARIAFEDACKNIGNYSEAIEVAPKGYGGEINMVVGISDTGEVTGVAIIRMSETPGLGTKTNEDSYLNQFIGKRAGVSIGKGANNVDAITGATISSRAVTSGVSEALDKYAEKIAGGAK